MAWVRGFALGAAIGLGVVAFAWRGSIGSPPVAVDLADRLDDADERRPAPDIFAVRDVVLAGTSRRAITVSQASRIVWRIDVPRSAALHVDLGLEEAAWSAPGDGVWFRIGLSIGDDYQELVSQVVDPANRPDDRRWHPVQVDLSPYAGTAINLVFNTRAGVGTADPANDLAAWGAPRVLTR